jgi:hypothetical protein
MTIDDGTNAEAAPQEQEQKQEPVTGDDVRPGPEVTDEPLAGTTEPTD